MSWGGGGDYGMSSYGGGGGFVAGQDSSQEKGGKKSSGDKSLLPITIKQLLDCTQEVPDDIVKIDGRDAAQVTLVGRIVNVTEGSAYNVYTIDDSTGVMDINFWLEGDEGEQSLQTRLSWEAGKYVRVVGNVRSGQNDKKWSVVAFHIRLIEDFNEVTYHLLDVCHAHLFNTRGMPSEAAVKYSAPVQPKVSNTPALGHSSAPPPSAQCGQAPAFSSSHSATSAPQQILEVFKGLDQAQCPHGWHIDHIIHLVEQQFGRRLATDDVRKILEKLGGDGHLYTTVDEDHYAST